jgi:transcription initiation factor TFIID subunit 15
MGDIPATTNMVSTIITNPAPGQALAANTDFNVNLQVANLNAGVFTNPTVTYYTAPQALKNGNIVGHVHVTIQTLGANLAPAVAPDATKFVFFKGIDDAGDGKGGLAALVKGGLPAGNYRVCTMSAAANHQPVAMPVAQ